MWSSAFWSAAPYWPESYTKPVGVWYGNWSGRMKFFIRKSAGSMLSS